MATQINQVDDPLGHKTILRVEGELLHDDAVLLERIAIGIRANSGNNITIDLADLDFLDSDAAPILKRLAETEGFAIDGVEMFLQSAVDSVERPSI